ncbi:MAG: DNA-binding response regulator [Aquificaceae bacterium]|nr:MAG: DNA-binding response regulator [Aquificaceae bacterium]
MHYTIAVVEDDPDLLEILEYNLKKEGFEVFAFERGEHFLKFMSEGKKPHLVVLDVMLPGMSGFELAKIIKGNEAYRDIPVVFLTAKTLEEDKLKGFELGADDYISKPFSVKEFIARIRVILRRYYPQRLEAFGLGELKLYPDRFEVFCGDKKVELTRAEFKILQTLLEKKGEVVKRSTLMDAIAPFGRETVSRAVDVHITKIRKKLGECGKYIKTVRGVGYKVQE